MKPYKPIVTHYSSRRSRIQAISESFKNRGFAVHVNTRGISTYLSIRGNGIAKNRLDLHDAQTFLMNWDREHAVQEPSSAGSISEAI